MSLEKIFKNIEGLGLEIKYPEVAKKKLRKYAKYVSGFSGMVYFYEKDFLEYCMEEKADLIYRTMRDNKYSGNGITIAEFPFKNPMFEASQDRKLGVMPCYRTFHVLKRSNEK